jgi:diadenosine tetraphosphatase ApaH/serine/threonine PP2A family protein phosphatase
VRACVISDIHGNLHALEAVLTAVAEEAPDELWCLGDLVGYGPRPNDCCRIVAERADLSLVGNHDLAALGRLDVAEFSPDAAASARWTAAVLADGARAFLESLEPTALRHEIGLYHASPRDPVWEYVLSLEAAAEAFAVAEERVALVGHSHVALAFVRERGRTDGGLAPADTELDLGAADRWLLNPGSVGQPRDGDPRAAFLVLDLDRGRGRFRRVPYAIERTQQEIREHGLPEALAGRLEHGM